MISTVLLIEDEPTLARNICFFLEREGFAVEMASSGEAGLEMLARFRPDVVLLDYSLPGIDGLKVLGRIMAAAPNTRVIMMTGSGSEQIAVNAFKGGAADYLKKPMELAALRLVIDRVLQRRRAADLPEGLRLTDKVQIMDTLQRRRKGDPLDAQTTSWQGKLVAEPMHGASPPAPARTPSAAGAPRKNGVSALVGDSAPMFTLKALIGKINEADLQMSGVESPAVLVTGETGTGKELVARALHYESRRKAGPFIELNCAGIPASLLEAELFGYERGAFTDAKTAKLGLIESAAGGTLFLDEIGDLDLGSQAKLLKVLEERRVRRLGSVQERSVDARFLAATSCDLEGMVREGRFRADLYYRLRMIHVHVPALRERSVDVLRLAGHFLDIYAARYGKPDLRISSEAMAALSRHTWPGNVRELKNTIEQSVILASGSAIGVGDLSMRVVSEKDQTAPAAVFERGYSMNLPKVERDMLVAALQESRANVSKAARMLGISRDTLRYRAKKFDIAF